MDAAHIPPESEQSDELEDAEILALLLSSDAESSSSDDEIVLPSNKKCLA